MCNFLRSCGVLLIVSVLLAVIPGLSISGEKTGSVGLYIYENIEGEHTISSAAGTELGNTLLEYFGKVSVIDRVPLESNETVRILDEMTKERKVTVTSVHTWLSGGVISSPTLTFADDAIKFKDLTWHIDSGKIIQDAGKRGLKKVLYGDFSGYVSPANPGNPKLGSVTVVANLRLMTVAGESVEWAKTYRSVMAGFDPRIAFNDAIVSICETVSEDLKEKF
ncbi:MAG: hypothetical protein JW746_04275 [Candidatus Krumholzibacteriota bacterium]|nr:hypothetical protein [Candidatus Krumholzibacteriota bacterium]